MVDLVLHHYDTSPFSEKVRVMFGLKGLSWRSVIQPVIMPKPELVPLTGGYRRIPVMQAGADVFCDSQVILAEIERRHPSPAAVTGAAWAVNLWADRLFFPPTVAVIFGEVGEAIPKEFREDRAKLSGRPFDTAAMKAAAVPMRAQWRAQAAWLDQGLAHGEWLAGAQPGLADAAAYFNIWWLGKNLPALTDQLLTGLPRVQAWRARVAALGHGIRTEMTPAEALTLAREAEPVAAPPHDDRDPLSLSPGAAVHIMADDYGRDPIAGVLMSLTPDRVVIARDDADLGRLHIHFPRVGYIVAPART